MSTDDKTYSSVIHYIKELIRSGELREGDKLPTERMLSQNLNMSRNSIREALRTMETLGLIESRQGSGNYLTGTIGKAFTETLTMMLLMNKIDYKNLNQVRRALEYQTYRSLMNNVTKEQLDTLEQKLVSVDMDSISETSKYDSEFHQDLIALSGNPIMIGIMESLAEVLQVSIQNNLAGMDERERDYEWNIHKTVLEGLREKNLEKGLEAITGHYDLIDEKLE